MSAPVLEFLHPRALALGIPLVFLLWLLARRSRSVLPARLRLIVALCRGAALLLVVAALAGPQLFGPQPERVVVLLEDASASTRGAAAEAASTFEAELREALRGPTRVERLRLGARPLPAEAGAPEAGASDLGAGLRLAGCLVPEGAPGAVVLFSDGGDTAGEARRAAAELAWRGIPVHTVPVSGSAAPDAFPVRVVLPEPWWPGGVELLQVLLASNREGLGELEIRVDGESLDRRQVRVAAGQETRVPVALRVDRPGGHRLELLWAAPWDESAANDHLGRSFAVQEPFSVFWIREAPGEPWALLAEAGFETRGLGPEEAAGLLAAGARPDLVVLDDVPAARMGDAALARLAELTREAGTGLLLAGARSSFGPGGYAGTPIEPLLPVLLEQREERRDPSVALALIVDTSGSMGNRVDLAKEVARLALGRLKPHDKVGIVEFYGHKRWAAPLQPASNQIDILRALNRLQAEGGTVLMPAIEEAYYGLLNVTTRFKHVLVLTDGGVEQGAFEPLVRRMAEEGITVSTVLVGPGQDSEFLLNLAQWGRGRYYQAPGRFQLPEIILKQPTSSILPPLVGGPLRAGRGSEAPDLEGLDLEAAPALAGAVETRAREGAEVLLACEGGVPLLARWRHGMGRVVCWATETQGPLLGEWAAWEGYGRIMRRVLREACRRTGHPWLEAWAERERERVAVCARALDARGAPALEGILEVRRAGALLGRSDLFAPGRFRLELPADALAEDGEPLLVGLAGEPRALYVPVPPRGSRNELALLGLDEECLADLAAAGGGAHRASAARAAGLLQASTGRVLPSALAPWLLLAAALLYLAEILLRRWPRELDRPEGPR